jgi:hypothetical protein
VLTRWALELTRTRRQAIAGAWETFLIHGLWNLDSQRFGGRHDDVADLAAHRENQLFGRFDGGGNCRSCGGNGLVEPAKGRWNALRNQMRQKFEQGTTSSAPKKVDGHVNGSVNLPNMRVQELRGPFQKKARAIFISGLNGGRIIDPLDGVGQNRIGRVIAGDLVWAAAVNAMAGGQEGNTCRHVCGRFGGRLGMNTGNTFNGDVI